MTDLAERLLRDVLTEDATRAPLPGDLGRTARRRLRHRRIRTAGAGVAVTVGAVGAATVVLPVRDDRVPVVAAPPAGVPVTGIQWLLVEYRLDGRTVASSPDETLWLQIDGERFVARGCNTLTGSAEVSATHVTFTTRRTTTAACSDSPLSGDFARFAADRLEWRAAGSTLRLTAPDGDWFTFAERMPPSSHEATTEVLVGERDGWKYRLTAGERDFYLTTHPGPTPTWTLTMPQPIEGGPVLRAAANMPVADDVLMAGWATTDTARATYEHPGEKPVELMLHRFDSRAIYSGFVPEYSRSGTITLYREDGSVIESWPR